MNNLLSLGDLYLNNFLSVGEEPGDKYDLSLVMDESCGAARLKTVAPLSKMYGKYWYRSGTNQSMNRALKDVVDSILPFVPKLPATWLDIACNDGTLLKHVPQDFERIGVDPCEKEIFDKGIPYMDLYFNDFFKGGLYIVDVVTSIAMFYDLEDPDTFCKDVYEVMAEDGLWVIQMSYTPLMIKQLAFDNICHEHVYYHSVNSMKNILERNGFKICDSTLNDVNGGSFRLFVKKAGKTLGSKAYQDVCKMRIASLRIMEEVIDISNPATWKEFYRNVEGLKQQVVSFIKQAKHHGKTIMGYGASTKGNTLLQFFGLDNTLIDAIAERQEKKWGLRTPGTNIPIISEADMRKANPDYLLVLPWHFITEFAEREKDYLSKGGKMIVPCPKFEVI